MNSLLPSPSSVRKVDENYRTVDTSRKTDKQDEQLPELNISAALI